MFTLGLLRGVGVFAIRAALPNEANAVLNRQLHTGEHLHEIEHSILGFSHAELSGKLLHNWQLPAPLVQPVKNYINPHLAGEYRVEAAVIYIANYMKNERFDVPQPPLKDNLLHPLAVQDLELIHELLPEAIRLSGDAGKLITG